jgi:hypothetical protein
VKDVLQGARRTSGCGGDVPEADLPANAPQRIGIGAPYGGRACGFMAARRRGRAQRLNKEREQIVANGLGVAACRGGQPRIGAETTGEVP